MSKLNGLVHTCQKRICRTTQNFDCRFTTNKLFGRIQVFKWIKVPLIISFVNKYFTSNFLSCCLWRIKLNYIRFLGRLSTHSIINLLPQIHFREKEGWEGEGERGGEGEKKERISKLVCLRSWPTSLPSKQNIFMRNGNEAMDVIGYSPFILGLGRYPRPQAQFFPLRTSRLVNNIYVYLAYEEQTCRRILNWK